MNVVVFCLGTNNDDIEDGNGNVPKRQQPDQNPENYRMYYDIVIYTYSQHPDDTRILALYKLLFSSTAYDVLTVLLIDTHVTDFDNSLFY